MLASIEFSGGRQSLAEFYTLHFIKHLLKHSVAVENSIRWRAYNALSMLYQSLYKHAFTRACWTRYHAGEWSLPDVMCHDDDDDEDWCKMCVTHAFILKNSNTGSKKTFIY